MNAEAAPEGPRTAWRRRLIAAREVFAASPAHAEAERALAAHLAEVLAQLAPDGLGLYWPLRSEFNAASACRGDKGLHGVALSLPWAEREPRRMHYRLWDGREPAVRDGCGIPSAAGAETVPDVVLVPCVGYTAEGFRLGYGGGYFDRWLSAHPQVTAVGIAWSTCELPSGAFVPEPHDQPLMLVITERGVVGG